MNVAEEIIKAELEMVAPVEDLVAYNADYEFEFPCRAGHLINYFSCEGLTVLEDRQ